MKRVFTLTLTVLWALTVHGQTLLYETFSEGVPCSWTLFDDGNQAANPQFSAPWSAQGAYGNPAPCAVSTSWFVYAEDADRWMITEPVLVTQQGYCLILEAAAFEENYADGFEVRVSTTGCASRSDFGSPLLRVPHCATEFQTYIVPLDDYVGDSVWVAVIQNNYDMNLLFVDNLRIARPDAPELELTRLLLPDTVSGPVTLRAQLTNKSRQPFQGTIHYHCSVNGANLLNESMDISLDPGESLTFTSMDSLLLTDTLNRVTVTVDPVDLNDFAGNNTLTVKLNAEGQVVDIHAPLATRHSPLKVYPNPTPGPFTVEGAMDPVRLFDLSGRPARQPLRPGTYILTDGHSATKLVITQ